MNPPQRGRSLVYLRDCGLMHELLGIADAHALERHPRCGASWEGFALDQVLRVTRPDEAYFWATHAGAELDLLMFKDGRRVGVEFKYGDAPTTAKSMRVVLADLELDALYVVYPGTRCYALDERIEVVPLAQIQSPSSTAPLLALEALRANLASTPRV